MLTMKTKRNSRLTWTLLLSWMILGSTEALSASELSNDNDENQHLRGLEPRMTTSSWPLPYACNDSNYDWYAPCGTEVGINTRICIDTRDGKAMCALKSLTCDETPCDESTSVCLGGKCECLVGYVKNSSGKCVPSCQNDTCGGVNSECVSGHCVCKDGYGLNEHRTTCVDEGDCPFGCGDEGNNSQCYNGKCECKEGYEALDDESITCSLACSVNALFNPISRTCQCKAGFINVSGDDEPQECCPAEGCGANSECVNGSCVCMEGFVPINAGDTSECEEPCASVTCGDFAYCLGGFCLCEEGYDMNDDMVCEVIDVQEIIEVKVCEPECAENERCINGRCRCAEGLIRSRFGGCRIRFGRGALWEGIRNVIRGV